MISVEQALGILASATRPAGTEKVPLAQALGRVLAQEVVSDVDWPPFDTSAMDGYAVRLADVPEAGGTLRERPSLVAAGDPPPPPVVAGEAVRVMTGAPIPEGTEAIVPVERVSRADGRVVFGIAPSPGQHIRRRGESVPAGRVLLSAGQRLTASSVALAALAGCEPVEAFRRPPVAIAATGNELVAASETPGPGQLRDGNGPMLVALCRQRGWDVVSLPRAVDEAGAVELLFAGDDGSDNVLLTCGGVSAGDLDLLPRIAARCGFELVFHGVAMRPGKPIIFARRGRRLWFGLPGNPVSASVGFHLFVRFALDRLEGDRAPGAPRLAARLTQDIKSPGSRETYRDGLLTAHEGVVSVEPIATRGSHDIAAHARANALIRLPAGSAAIPAGEIVGCLVVGEVTNN